MTQTPTDHYSQEFIAVRTQKPKAALERKARAGECHWRTSLGYLPFEGYPSIPPIDPVRGPLIREAFKLAASGKYTLRQLLTVMSEKGLTTRAGKPLSNSTLLLILKNPFYTGVVKYRGSTYPGKHWPLLPTKIFCQTAKHFALRRLV